ncbi:hypothetical protein WMY93_031465, partial [Mugilogobius chulae]
MLVELALQWFGSKAQSQRSRMLPQQQQTELSQSNNTVLCSVRESARISQDSLLHRPHRGHEQHT